MSSCLSYTGMDECFGLGGATADGFLNESKMESMEADEEEPDWGGAAPPKRPS
jgi:hypothetical protein